MGTDGQAREGASRCRTLAASVGTRRSTWTGLTLFFLGLIGAASLTEGVMEHGDLSVLDPLVAADVSSWHEGVLTFAADLATYIGSAPVIGLMGALLSVWAWTEWRDRRGAVLLAGAFMLSAALGLILKHVVARPRPAAGETYGTWDSSPAFPSGHTLGTAVFLGLVAMILLFGAHARTAKAVGVFGGVAGTLFVAFSRIYLGDHWLTDVLAGLSLAVMVLGGVLICVDVLRVRSPDWRPFSVQAKR